jgi:heme a synthase
VVTARYSSVRFFAWSALLVTYLQTVFGAVVRITGSGMGCGEEWPRCRPAGSARAYWIPPFERPDLIIEITHRYLAVAVGLLVVALYLSALRTQRWSLRAVILVAVAAILGRETVRLGLSPLVVMAHLSVALLTLGVLVYVVILARRDEVAERAGEFPTTAATSSSRTRRAAVIAAVMTFVVVLAGALTATVPRAAGSCEGFPHCRAVIVGGTPLTIHLAHRVLAFLLFFHLLALAINAHRRGESRDVRVPAWSCAGLVTAQLLVAAAMVEMRFPLVLRSVHQAIGVAVWLATMTFAVLAVQSGRKVTARAGL